MTLLVVLPTISCLQSFFFDEITFLSDAGQSPYQN